MTPREYLSPRRGLPWVVPTAAPEFFPFSPGRLHHDGGDMTDFEYLVIKCANEQGIPQGLQSVRVHSRLVCKDRALPCCVHSPSNHLMVTWPQFWRDDTGRMYRLCSHGFTHPDPDDLTYVEYVKGHVDIRHPCDGCCGY